jgi:tetratricopeptide (TPR) repeat protein
VNQVARRFWFPLSLMAAVSILFVAFGPFAADSSAARLRQMAPPGAGDGPFVTPDGASATEREIAKRYEVVRTAPDTVEAYVLLGDAYLQHVRETADPQDYGRAQAALEEARSRAPDNADALVGLGVLALARHDFAGALKLGQQAVALAPSSSRAQGVIVDALTELGRYDEAIDSAQRMVDLRPDLASLSRVAYQRELRGDVDGAIEAMARAFDAAAGTRPENREYLRVLIGDLYLLKGDAAKATQIYRASLDVIPGFVPANAGMARAAVARGDLTSAIDYYRKATDALPLPELLVAQGEAEEAAGLANEANQTYALVRAMVKLYAANGVNVDLELALFEANHGDANAAVDLARRAYSTQPNVKAADALSWALYRAGHTGEAAAYSAEALRLGTQYPSFAYHAGMIALAQGTADEAHELLSRAGAATGTLSPLDLAAAVAALAEASR